MTQPFDTKPIDLPDPSCYLRKREGSPGGLKPEPARKQRQGGTGGSPRAGPGSPKAAVGSPKGATGTHFRRLYDRGDLPIRVDQCRPGHNTIKWTADLSTIDLHYYLPVFADGLQETQEPYRMLARRGFDELLCSPAAGGARVLPVIPQLVMPLRGSLTSGSPEVIQAGLRALELLAGCCPEGGAALRPYYRQLLPPIGRHIDDNLNIGDAIDYGQAKHRGSLGDLVTAALNLLERTGGPDAFHHIKYQVPTYESCQRPSRLARKP